MNNVSFIVKKKTLLREKKAIQAFPFCDSRKDCGTNPVWYLLGLAVSLSVTEPYANIFKYHGLLQRPSSAHSHSLLLQFVPSKLISLFMLIC